MGLMKKVGRNTAVEHKKIFMTIGIIFRDNIRSIERCLKALQPLRDAMPCELILVDTGSVDGSRQVAERYADILFDFEWVNDFAAARNAIMERASGEWFFTVDTDEYLDEDISDLTKKLPKLPPHIEACSVIQRNYDTFEMDASYTDFKGAVRILRMSTGMRYHGAIHERWEHDDKAIIQTVIFDKTILHHDGYVGLNGAAGEDKRRRNITLLRDELEKSPEALITHLQFLESGMGEPDLVEKLDQAVALVEAHKPHWNSIGPAILRYGVIISYNNHLPDMEDRVQCAQKWFPASAYTRLDVECFMFLYLFDSGRYEESIRYGNRYLSALKKYQDGGFDPGAEMCSTVRMTTPHWGELVKMRLAFARLKCGEYDETAEALKKVDYTTLDEGQTVQIYNTILELHRTSRVDTAGIITTFWSAIASREDADSCKKIILNAATQAFSPAGLAKDRKDKTICRCSYTLFAPLAEQYDIGLAAAMLETEDVEVLSRQLAEMRDWQSFPLAALTHALQKGAVFPPPGTKWNVEEMDMLAGCIAQDQSVGVPLAIQTAQKDFTSDWLNLMWAKSLAMATVRGSSWKELKVSFLIGDASQALSVPGMNKEQYFLLARAFAKVEKEFLGRCYAAEVLHEDTLCILPSLHRFGWYCAQAFEALDAGDSAGYARLLRAGLETCGDMKPMVEFLRDNTPELQIKPEPSAELKALADQIRAVLANFSPDDPAVAALKQSEAYQKVAYLIEGIEAPVMGGLKQ